MRSTAPTPEATASTVSAWPAVSAQPFAPAVTRAPVASKVPDIDTTTIDQSIQTEKPMCSATIE